MSPPDTPIEPAAPKGAHVLTGERDQPEQLPAQHLPPDGQEHDLELQPRFRAPEYEGSHKLKASAR
jgi:hypothetical protein